MTLDQIKPGQSIIIVKVNGQGLLRRRLLEMGLTPNTLVKVRKVAPMGDPIDIELRDYQLCIRKADLMQIEVEVIE